MSRFQKTEKRGVPALNTSALPDLIFTILFFFMIVTNMRPVPVKTQFSVPDATELQKLAEKSHIVYLMIGKAQNSSGESNVIQLNSDFIALDEMPLHLSRIKDEISVENREKIVVVLKADKNVPMGLIGDVKQNLREAGMLTIHYSVNKKRD